jgi:DHA1 family multidrug resistance protein-like MFS transporter
MPNGTPTTKANASRARPPMKHFNPVISIKLYRPAPGGAELFPTKRGERISLPSSVTYVGRLIAPILGGYILFGTAKNFHVLYLAVGASGVTAIIIAFPFLVEGKAATTQQPRREETVARLFRGWKTVTKCYGVLLVVLIQACQYYAYGAVEFFLAGYLPEVAQLDPFLTGIIIASIAGIGIFARPYMGRVSDRVGRRAPIVFGCILSGVPLFAIPFFTDFLTLFLLVLVYGFGFAAVASSTNALISDLVPRELVGTSMGFLDTLMDIGQTIGPIISGLILATSLQYKGVFPSLSLLLIVAGVVFASARVRERKQTLTPKQ